VKFLGSFRRDTSKIITAPCTASFNFETARFKTEPALSSSSTFVPADSPAATPGTTVSAISTAAEIRKSWTTGSVMFCCTLVFSSTAGTLTHMPAAMTTSGSCTEGGVELLGTEAPPCGLCCQGRTPSGEDSVGVVATRVVRWLCRESGPA